MAKIILICGKIASGKSYYANQLKETEHAVILSVDELTFDMFDNEQGELYDDRAKRAQQYLLKKSIEFVKAGCNVILDWGFWQRDFRIKIEQHLQSNDITTQWHYVDVDEVSWEKNIKERNTRIEQGQGGSDFYVDEGLKQKLLSYWDEPTKDEIDVWHTVQR